MPIRLEVHSPVAERTHIAAAAAAIAHGKLVVVPTDTFYGIAVDPRSAAALARLFEVKGRDAERAIPVVGTDTEQVERITGRMPPRTRALARRFWPGPLSLIVAAPPSWPALLHGGTGTLAVRVPDEPVLRALCRAVGGLVTATSANRSGEPPAVHAADVIAALGEDVDVVLDAGALRGGWPSTIVDAREASPRLIRAGAVSWDRVLECLG